MAEKKIYSAFISSVFESLRDERSEVIDALLDYRILPICMEHFTVSTSGKFSDIEALIDESDFFILLLGKYYGSTDAEGIAWTEREYDYATKKKKHIIAIICDELAENKKKDPSLLSTDERAQIAFSQKISFARTVSSGLNIHTIMSQVFSTFDFTKCVGWTRIEEPGKDEAALKKWQEEHRVFDLSGIWYHVHLSDEDDEYIRVGTIKISQEFTPESYLDLTFEGLNYSVLYYDQQTRKLKENVMKSSKFVGEYKMEENGKIFGIFRSKRAYNGTFNLQEVTKGERRGIHDFEIDVFQEETVRIDGEFHDEAPSPKLGRIFIFRSEAERNEFILEHRAHVIEHR